MTNKDQITIHLPCLGWTQQEAAEIRAQLISFEKLWDAPGMEEYDTLSEENMTNKDQISINTTATEGVEKCATRLIYETIIAAAYACDRPRTNAAIARSLGIDVRKLARWLKKLDINIHNC